jgi:hypothetical protein
MGEPAVIMRPILKVSILESIINRKDWVKYKTIPEWHGRVVGDRVIVSTPTKEFIAAVEAHVNAYIFDKKAPPAEIATAVMNVADDILSDREVVLRSGDYIALQNFLRPAMMKEPEIGRRTAAK